MEVRLDKWQKDVEDELRRQREAANFRAAPASVLEKEPFLPAKSEKPLAEVSNFELHSDRRAREREAYEAERMQKEAELEARKLEVSENEISSICFLVFFEDWSSEINARNDFS